MPSAIALWLIAFTLSSSGWTVRARRFQEADLSAANATGTYKVHLLLSRHGLSCAEIIEHWISKFDYNGRLGISDPSLTGAGILGSSIAGRDVERWLTKQDVTLDAVISSQLLRELQSALIMYPQHKDPLQVAPFLMKERGGNANQAKDRSSQVYDLKNVVESKFQVNYKWLDRFGSEEGDWKMFLHFLEQGFLPELVKRKQKAPGSTIVIAIVTHSMYIKESEFGGKCSHLWTKKPFFNQVLDLEYTFSSIAPRAGSADATPLRTLKSKEGKSSCQQVSAGLELLKTGLCIQDIGQQCILPIKKMASSPGALWQQMAELAILDAAREIESLEEELAVNKRKAISAELALQRAETHGPVHCTSAGWLSSCKPEKFCYKHTFGGCSVKDDFNVDVLKQRIRKLSIAMVNLDGRISKAMEDLSKQRTKECWTGGAPNPSEFLRYGLAGQVPQRVRDLALGQANETGWQMQS